MLKGERYRGEFREGISSKGSSFGEVEKLTNEGDGSVKTERNRGQWEKESEKGRNRPEKEERAPMFTLH